MLNVKKLEAGAKIPTVGHEGDLGYDLYALTDHVLVPNVINIVRTGVSVQDTNGYGFIVKDRSSMALKGVFTHAGVIDPGYRGEIVVLFTSLNEVFIHPGDKIAQMVPVHSHTGLVHHVDSLEDSMRGTNGFGSTGR